MREENVVFIISQPRSGSTYLQRLLSNNPCVNTCSEPWIHLNFANILKPELVQGSYDAYLANLAFTNYLSKYPETNFKSRFKEFLLSLYEPMLDGFELVIDKTPRYWEILHELYSFFPNAKFIILKRNPLNVATSIIKTWDKNDLERLSENKRDLLLAPKVLHDFCSKFENEQNVYCLSYEALQKEAGVEVRKLYDWLGLEFSEAVLDVSKNDKTQGVFGDPFQNSMDDSEMKRIKSKPLNSKMSGFIEGYAHYLGKDFLRDYGNYTGHSSKPNQAFNAFLNTPQRYANSSSRKSIRPSENWLITKFKAIFTDKS